MSFIDKIDFFRMDVLKEIGNIGAAHAATSLSHMLGQKINMRVPGAKVVSFNQMLDMAGGADHVAATIFLRVEGDIKGSMFFVLPLPVASYFIKQMTDEDFSFNGDPLKDLHMSALQELGNILSGSYLTSLSDFTKLNIYPSVPSLSIDMTGATISTGLIELSQTSDHAIVIETLIEKEGVSQLSGHFFLLPDPDSFEIIFASLGVGTNG
ncbi:chemotaxis protein CheC [Bacillus massiliglaciei]|uniref:chemotaxis protein CheC n=1 Tax=Bacillus massiliglaciei TaxID=1816693 RepID=UPI000B2BA3BA|nr:chemotaxis protein CheC [Bacillus massiliglaciei]